MGFTKDVDVVANVKAYGRLIRAHVDYDSNVDFYGKNLMTFEFYGHPLGMYHIQYFTTFLSRFCM